MIADARGHGGWEAAVVSKRREWMTSPCWASTLARQYNYYCLRLIRSWEEELGAVRKPWENADAYDLDCPTQSV